MNVQISHKEAFDLEYWKPLHFYASTGNLEVMRQILNDGEDANVVPNNRAIPNLTALHIAACTGNVDVIKLLLSHCDVDKQDQFKEWLTYIGGGEFVRKFLDAGYDLAFIAKHGLSEPDLDCVGVPASKMGLRRKMMNLHGLDKFFTPEEDEDEDEEEEEEGSEEEDEEGSEEDED
eukprot:scaffold4103_cov248-Ochromonas_danica.AAC.15